MRGLGFGLVRATVRVLHGFCGTTGSAGCLIEAEEIALVGNIEGL